MRGSTGVLLLVFCRVLFLLLLLVLVRWMADDFVFVVKALRSLAAVALGVSNASPNDELKSHWSGNNEDAERGAASPAGAGEASSKRESSSSIAHYKICKRRRWAWV